MAKPPRDLAQSASQTYFISLHCWNGRSVLQSDRMIQLFLETLQSYRQKDKFQLHEFVVMPNHVHLLLSTRPNTTLEKAIQFIKGGFSFRAGKEFGFVGEIWQRGYVDHRVRDVHDYNNHREYIRMNPVRDRSVSIPEEFAYSSANPVYLLDAVPQGLKPGLGPSSRHD